jgi:hypothetical protein
MKNGEFYNSLKTITERSERNEVSRSTKYESFVIKTSGYQEAERQCVEGLILRFGMW